MENNSGLSSIRKKNKDVFGRSNRRYPVFIVAVVLLAALFVVSAILTANQNKEIKEFEDKVEVINRQIRRFENESSKNSEAKIDVGALMQRLSTSNTVSSEAIMDELLDYISMAEINTTTCSIQINENQKLPLAVEGVSDKVGCNQCHITVKSEALTKVTNLLAKIYEGNTFYYLSNYSIETSEDVVQASITLYTFYVIS